MLIFSLIWLNRQKKALHTEQRELILRGQTSDCLPFATSLPVINTRCLWQVARPPDSLNPQSVFGRSSIQSSL